MGGRLWKWTTEFAGIVAVWGGFCAAVLFLFGLTKTATTYFETNRAVGVIVLIVSYLVFLIHKAAQEEAETIKERRRELSRDLDE